MQNVAGIKINVYRSGGEWFGARWIDGQYDGCDSLDIDDDATDAEAIAHAALMPLSVPDETPRSVTRVADVTPVDDYPPDSERTKRTDHYLAHRHERRPEDA